MKKFLHCSIPFVMGCLLLGMLFYMVGVSHQVVAAGDIDPKMWMGKEFSKLLDEPQSMLIVNTLADELNSDGDCSLREAIEAANTNSTVDACGSGDVLTDTITFDVEGIITVNRPLTVTVGGPLVIYGGETVSTSGGNQVRIFHVDPEGILTLEGLGITNGKDAYGGGIDNSGSLFIENCSLFSNSATGYYNGFGGSIFNAGYLIINNSTLHDNQTFGYWGLGGAIFNDGTMEINNSSITHNTSWYDRGGGIYNDGTLLIRRSNLYDNSSYHDGGAIANQGALMIYDSNIFDSSVNYSGGGIFNQTGTMTITNSTLDNCHALNGGAIYNNTGKMILQNTTLSNNGAVYDGGSIFNSGSSVITLTNSTLSSNIAGYWGGGIRNEGSVTISNATITGNSAEEGGGYYGYGFSYASNSIISNNPTGGDCANGVFDGGHNISSDDTCNFDPINGSIPNTNPLLGPLQDNGGSTWTHAIQWNSPAIDAGGNPQCPSTDQREIPRPLDGNGDGLFVCDIGSFELNPVSPIQLSVNGPKIGYLGKPYSFLSNVEPISTSLPLTYTWQADGQFPIIHIGELTDTISYTWEITGTMLITVTAENPFGLVSNNSVVIINKINQFYLPVIKK
jgi:CSLREA domain-containing protein